MKQFGPVEYRRDDYTISTDKSRLSLDVVHSYLTRSYWSPGIPLEIVARCIENSLCFGIYFAEQQIGFAQVISDYTSFAYLADVFVLEEHRGKGLSKWLMECIMALPQLQGLRRWMLATKDAHGLYAKYGFKPLKHPEMIMELHDPDVYRKK